MTYTKVNAPSFVMRTVSKEYTCAGNSPTAAGALDFDLTYSGYTYVGLAGVSTGNGGMLIQQARPISSSVLRMYARNVTSSSITTTANVDLMYVKN